MALRWRWPLRRQGDSDVSNGAARSEGTPRDVPPEDRGQPAAVEIDPGFAGDFRGRAGDRDATPLLGPWGGLAETAQFAVAATHFQETLVTQRFSDEVAGRGVEPGDSASNFISSLGSLASYSDPAGTPGESGSPFADVLPVGRGDLFAPAPSAPVSPAYPSFSSAAVARAERPAARTERPVARATVPGRTSATPEAPAASARPSEPRGPIQRSTDSSPAASRPRSTVTESESPPASAVAGEEATAPLPLDPASPSSPAAPEPNVLPFAPPAPARDSAAAASTPGSRPASLATPVASAPVARLPDPSPPEPRASSELAAPPLGDGVLASPPGQPLGRPDVPPVARPPVEPLPLADQSPSEPASGPSAAIPPSPSDGLPAGDGVSVVPPSSPPPAAAAPPVLVQREAAPPLPDADVPPQAPSAPAESPLTPRVRRFSIGEPLRADIARATASGPGPSMRAPRETIPGLTQPEPTVAEPGLPPVARVTSVEPAQSVPEGPISDQPGSDVPPFAPARIAGSDLPLAGERGPETSSGAGDPPLPFAMAPRLNPGESSVRRVVDAATAPTGSAPASVQAPSAALLFRAPAAAPLRIEAAPAPADVSRATDAGPGTGTSPQPAQTPALAPRELPLGPAGGRAEAGSVSETGSPFPGQPSVQRVPAGFTAGTPAQRAPIVWRASDPGTVSMDAPSEASEAAATAGDAGPAEPQRSPEQDLDKLTEKVWQRLRRTLQLERERRRGLP